MMDRIFVILLDSYDVVLLIISNPMTTTGDIESRVES